MLLYASSLPIGVLPLYQNRGAINKDQTTSRRIGAVESSRIIPVAQPSQAKSVCIFTQMQWSLGQVFTEYRDVMMPFRNGRCRCKSGLKPCEVGRVRNGALTAGNERPRTGCKAKVVQDAMEGHTNSVVVEAIKKEVTASAVN